MKDIVARLNEQMALTPDAYKNVILDAMDEVLWLRKEAKMWRLRATKDACCGTDVAGREERNATPEKQP